MFLNSVNLHLRSDVAVGAALSGGIDSSAIVMSMRKLQGSSLDLHTFSHIAEDPDICEEKWINLVGETAFTKVHKVKPIAEELLNDLNSLIYYQDEPFGSTSIYAQHRVMSLAKDNKIKVMLDGQGADEQLAGYNGYVGARLASLIRGCKWASVFRLFRNSTRIGFVQPKTLLMNTGRHFLPASFQANIKKSLGVDKVTHWLSIKWFEDRKVTYPGYKIENKKTVMRYRLYESMTRGPLNCLLRYEDRNSMAFSIESRVPFLTPDLTNFIFSLPEEYILNRKGTSKSVFRHAMSGIVPDSILNRKDKIGFATSEFKWLRVLKPWIEGTLNSDVAQSIPILKIDKFKIDWNNILSAKATFDWRVWRVINLIKWCEINKVNFN